MVQLYVKGTTSIAGVQIQIRDKRRNFSKAFTVHNITVAEAHDLLIKFFRQLEVEDKNDET